MTLLELRAEIPLIFVELGSYFPHISADARICRLRLLSWVSDAFILHFSLQEPHKQGKTHFHSQVFIVCVGLTSG